ncbi:hypothetical protein GQX73_g3029 [Xylaria multiplex]|uniref:Stress-response A/B barrel domain-containing protein n=1 Tax=Xylaria multiplex TaxID=323545 RepID=A0A7C8MVH5_9PEZI|nr:hypothetical protein GQX73_g3029 [Xylaria multiplex]
MAIIEIALMKLKKELIKDIEKKMVPALNIKLNKAGVQNGLRGFFVTEGGRVSKDGEFTDILLLQWPTFQHFKDFIASPDYHEFSSGVKEGGYASGPPDLRLFDVADEPSSLFGSNTVIEYLTVRPKDISELGVQSVLKKLQSELPKFGTSKVVVGSSLNLEPKQFALARVHHAILYTATGELDAAKASTTWQQLLADIGHTADVTSLVAHVKKEHPLAK